jgi:Tfp pilus assembly protein PilN
MKFQINIYKPGKKGKEARHVKAVPKESIPTRLPVFIFIGIIMLILLAFAYFYSWKIAPLKREMRADQKRIILLSQLLNQGGENRGQKSGVDEVLVRLAAQRVLWKGKLVELSHMVPDDIRLTRLTMDIVEKTPDRRKPRIKVKETVLTIKGETLTTPGQDSLDHVARLILNLNESPSFYRDFEPLALVYTQRVKTREREFMEFELTGRLQQKWRKE